MSGENLRRLGKLLSPRADGEPTALPVAAAKLRQATVSAVGASTVDVLIGGDTDVATGGWVGDRPVVGDTVLVAHVAGSVWVLGPQQGGGGAWTDFAYGAGFGNQGAPYSNGGWRREDARVFLRGVSTMAGGTLANAVATTLPAGARPPAQRLWFVECSDGVARRFELKTNGDIFLFANGPGGGVALCWDAFSFDL